MAVREDWTRITRSVHSFISALIPSTGASKSSRTSIPIPPRVPQTKLFVRSTMSPRFLAEIERKRNQAYLSNLRNQIR
ncbi:MAG TPA: hypothetical protein VGS11_09780 [Candidatus Bathyarchaeia archaeon]|nr:hypothetical protein [Candidatus Bathyarchaeia archaeon]